MKKKETNLICRIVGHLGWANSLTELLPTVWGNIEERENWLEELASRKCWICSKCPKDYEKET